MLNKIVLFVSAACQIKLNGSLSTRNKRFTVSQIINVFTGIDFIFDCPDYFGSQLVRLIVSVLKRVWRVINSAEFRENFNVKKYMTKKKFVIRDKKKKKKYDKIQRSVDETQNHRWIHRNASQPSDRRCPWKTADAPITKKTFRQWREIAHVFRGLKNGKPRRQTVKIV